MHNKQLLLALGLTSALLTWQSARAAEAPRHYSLTPRQAIAAVAIAEAIIKEQPEQVISLYNKYFAPDLTISPYKKYADQRILAKDLKDTVKTTLVLMQDPSFESLHNKAGKQFLQLIPETLVMERQDVFDKLGTQVLGQITDYLSAHDLLNLITTSKHAKELFQPQLKNYLSQYWSRKIVPVTLEGLKGTVSCMAFSNDSSQIAIGFRDGEIIIWNLRTGKEVKRIEGHKEVSSIAFSPTQKILSAGYYGSKLIIWDLLSGKPIYETQFDQPVTQQEFSRDGRHLAALFLLSKIIWWDMNLHEKLWETPVDSDFFKFTSDGKTILSVGMKNLLFINRENGKLQNKLTYKSTVLILPDVTPDMTHMAWFYFDERDLIVYNILQKTRTPKHPSRLIISLKFSPDGQLLAFASSFEGGKSFIAFVTLDLQEVNRIFTDATYKIQFSPDGKIVASETFEGEVTLWHAQ